MCTSCCTRGLRSCLLSLLEHSLSGVGQDSRPILDIKGGRGPSVSEAELRQVMRETCVLTLVASCSDSGSLLVQVLPCDTRGTWGGGAAADRPEAQRGSALFPRPAQQEAGQPSIPSVSPMPSVISRGLACFLLQPRCASCGEATAKGSRWHPMHFHSRWGLGRAPVYRCPPKPQDLCGHLTLDTWPS